MLLGSELQNKLGSGGLFAHDAIALKVGHSFDAEFKGIQSSNVTLYISFRSPSSLLLVN